MIEVTVRVRLDPAAPLDIERYDDVADRPVVAVKHLDVPEHEVGARVLNVLRDLCPDEQGI